jgi:uncharacterized membrane protein YhhN
MMPFVGGIEATPNALLVFSFVAAMITLLRVDAQPGLARSAAKTLATALLAVLAAVQGGPVPLVLALALSAAGDAFLSRNGDRAFMAGLASFLLAHLAYVALFWLGGGGVDLLFSGIWRPALAAAMPVFAIAVAAVLVPRVEPALRLPIAAYAAAILLMGLAALTTNRLPVIAGAVLFMASDAILATERFLTAAVSPRRPAMRQAVWITYYAAQLLITLGVLLS